MIQWTVFILHKISLQIQLKSKLKCQRWVEAWRGFQAWEETEGPAGWIPAQDRSFFEERKKRMGEKFECWWSNEDKHDADTNSNNKNSCKDEMNQKSHIFESKVILKTMNIFFDKMTEDFFARWPNWWWRCWSAGSRWGKRLIQRWSVFITIYKHNFDEMINSNNNNSSDKRHIQRWLVFTIYKHDYDEVINNNNKNNSKRCTVYTSLVNGQSVSSYINIILMRWSITITITIARGVLNIGQSSW